MAGFFGRHRNVYLYIPNLIGEKSKTVVSYVPNVWARGKAEV